MAHVRPNTAQHLARGRWPRLALRRATVRKAAHSHGATIAQGCWIIGRPSHGDGAQPSADVRGQHAMRVFLFITLLATRAWLRPVSRGNRHFTVGGGRLRQSGPRPETISLRSSCTRRVMDFITNGFSSKSWPEQIPAREAAAA
ncbi:hypothetical protein F511_27320 [Dorcoceras hygrometricum]|uniref:Uncharacterized protein n=1 Tax=Dorcoceras hygrometricum TaxID=472368 RepID=A0A2Z7B2J1_9LAMI|nr:hypothetical protein F511_27320 [Dorcoceras hygrometricum]